MLWLRLPGSLALRCAERAFLPLLIQLPPRSTRLAPVDSYPHPVYSKPRLNVQGGITLQVVLTPAAAIGWQGNRMHRVIGALQRAGKEFEMMFYPQDRHGIRGQHYMKLQLEFIRRTMGVAK